jgi:gas vesicle protein
MGRFLNGVIVGIGIGLLVAPVKGEEMRRQVRESFQELQTRMPDNEQLKQAGQQMAAGVSQTASQVKNYAQQATSQVKQSGQDVASTAQQTTPSMKQGRQTPTLPPNQGVNEPSIFADDMALDEGR